MRSRLLIPALFLMMACGGKAIGTFEEGSGRQASSQGAGEKETAATSGGTPAQIPAQASAQGRADCSYSHASGSGGASSGVATCITIDNYSCATSDEQISCECQTKIGSGQWSGGSCTCAGQTFEFDCANACTITDDIRAKCNLPSKPAEPPNTGSGSSGSGSSTSSSSGG